MEGLSKWEAPKDGFLKINVDGSWDAETGIAGCAGVSRDDEGIITGVKGQKHVNMQSATEVKAQALLEGLQWAGQARWRKCIFETDSTELFAYVSLQAKAPESVNFLVPLLKKNWQNALPSVKFV
ncbi:hypothetical protein QQ045_029703 [Rhodiola kirilowii]